MNDIEACKQSLVELITAIRGVAWHILTASATKVFIKRAYQHAFTLELCGYPTVK